MSKDNNKRVNIRKSGLRQFTQQEKEMIKKKAEDELINPKAIEEFEQEYSKISLKFSRKNKRDAYVIKFTHEPKAFFITFQKYKDRDTGKWEACKYFDSIHHPTIGLNDYSKARRTRVPEFDKYCDTGRVPIEKIMKLGAVYHCGICGQDTFDYNDLINNRCFVVRDEGSTNQFTDGIVICNNCRRKYFS